jgi:hypothetical protein
MAHRTEDQEHQIARPHGTWAPKGVTAGNVRHPPPPSLASALSSKSSADPGRVEDAIGPAANRPVMVFCQA